MSHYLCSFIGAFNRKPNATAEHAKGKENRRNLGHEGNSKQ